MGRTTQVYRDVLGFKVEGETAFAADKPTRALTGLDNAEVRRSRIQAPGSTLWIELAEFKGVERMPMKEGKAEMVEWKTAPDGIEIPVGGDPVYVFVK